MQRHQDLRATRARTTERVPRPRRRRRRSTSRRPTSTRSSSRRSRRTTRTSTSGWPAGTSLWYQDKGFAHHVRLEWQKVYSLPTADKTFTAVAYSGNGVRDLVRPVLNNGAAPSPAARSSARSPAGTWTFKPVDLPGRLPEPLPAGRGDRPEGREPRVPRRQRVLAPLHRRPGRRHRPHLRVEGRRPTWTDISGNFPDIPVNDVVVAPSGGLVAATDLGVLYRAPASTTWQRLGSSLPVTVAMDLTLGPDGNVYAATHGRGIWRISAAGL